MEKIGYVKWVVNGDGNWRWFGYRGKMNFCPCCVFVGSLIGAHGGTKNKMSKMSIDGRDEHNENWTK